MDIRRDLCKWKWKTVKWDENKSEAYASVQCKDGTLMIFDEIRCFTYCPYCGGKIVIVR